MADRIAIIYNAIDEMAQVHGSPRPDKFGGGIWNFSEEIKIWKEQVNEREKLSGRTPLTSLQWVVIDTYIDLKRQGLKSDDKEN